MAVSNPCFNALQHLSRRLCWPSSFSLFLRVFDAFSSYFVRITNIYVFRRWLLRQCILSRSCGKCQNGRGLSGGRCTMLREAEQRPQHSLYPSRHGEWLAYLCIDFVHGLEVGHVCQTRLQLTFTICSNPDPAAFSTIERFSSAA
ncbi:unnamed protein product, partial [Mycena citricolor]